jgi:hypothetical protein
VDCWGPSSTLVAPLPGGAVVAELDSVVDGDVAGVDVGAVVAPVVAGAVVVLAGDVPPDGGGSVYVEPPEVIFVDAPACPMTMPSTTNTMAVSRRCHVRHVRRSLMPSDPLVGTTATLPESGASPSPGRRETGGATSVFTE